MKTNNMEKVPSDKLKKSTLIYGQTISSTAAQVYYKFINYNHKQ